MKKFKSFKPENVEEESEKTTVNQHKLVKKKQTPTSGQVDLDFGKRLNFTEEVKKAANTSNLVKIEDSNSEASHENLKRLQADFNKKLRKDANNIDLWIDFVGFQDDLNRFEKKKKQKLVERKLFILKKAIELNPNSLRLALLYLQIAEETEDLAAMLKMWEGFLRDRTRYTEKDHVSLTLEYLKYRQRTFIAYNFEHVNQAFEEAFKSHMESSIDFVIALYREYFRFLKRSGFSEKIVALTQALIEICVEKWNYGEVDLDAYEDQWDFGLMQHAGDELLRIDDSDHYNSSDNLRRFREWFYLEEYREMTKWHPIHFVDDVEGQVIFDDVKSFLVIPSKKGNLLLLLKAVFMELGHLFDVKSRAKEIDFVYWYLKVYKTLIQFYKNDDWQFILNYFLLSHHIDPQETESQAKQLLSENRESLHIFLAYGRYQELIGNLGVATKVYEALKKRTTQFDDVMGFFPSTDYSAQNPEKWDRLVFSETDMKAEVYELIRANPGDKKLLMRIIESVEERDEQLAMEVYNLIVEQQLRLYTLLEEVEMK